MNSLAFSVPAVIRNCTKKELFIDVAKYSSAMTYLVHFLQKVAHKTPILPILCNLRNCSIHKLFPNGKFLSTGFKAD